LPGIPYADRVSHGDTLDFFAEMGVLLESSKESYVRFEASRADDKIKSVEKGVCGQCMESSGNQGGLQETVWRRGVDP
jgi:hypothetical protein